MYRIGNLTSRYQDGKFQKNIWENYFYNGLRFMLQTGMALSESLSESVEMTPVDACATAIVQLMKHGEVGKAYHVWNSQTIAQQQLIQMFKSLGYEIQTYKKENYAKKLDTLLSAKHDPKLFLGIINDFDEKENPVEASRSEIILQNHITVSYLERIGFEWPTISEHYLSAVLRDMQDKDFL